MVKKIILFYRGDKDQNLYYKLKNASLRNPTHLIEYMHYFGDLGWKDFIDNFKHAHRISIVKNSTPIDYDSNFVALYQDLVTKQEVIVVGYEDVLNLIVEP